VTMKAGSSGSLAFNDITFVDSGGVNLHTAAASNGDLFIDAGTNLDVDGALIITATTGNITQGSELEVGAASTFTTSASNGTITLNDADNTFTGAVALNTDGSSGNATIKNDTALLLAASTVDGTLTATATAGNITQNGALDIEGATTLVTSGQGADIVLTTDTNAFTSQLLITTDETGSNKDAHVSIDGGTTNLIIGTSTIDGDLSLRSGGTITDTNGSTVTVKGTLTATTDASHSVITLNDLAVVGAFTLAPDGTGAVTIVNAAGLILAASTMGGTFSGTATAGNITQTGALDIEGTTTLVTSGAGADIDLAANGTSNAFTQQLLITTNETGSDKDAHVSIDGGTTDLIIGNSTIDGNLTLLGGGTITDTDGSTVTVKGTLSATTDAGTSAITLNDLAVSDDITLAPNGTGAVTIVNAVGLKLAASTMGGTFSGTATTGNITQSGALDIEGTTTLVTTAQLATIDLATNGSGNAFTSELLITTNDNSSPYDTAHVSVDGGTTNLIIGTSTIGGDLTLLSGGTITDTNGSTVTVKRDLSATTDASDRAITLNDLAVDGAFTLAPDGTGAVIIVNAEYLKLAASTMGGTFSGTATEGEISDIGVLTITGAATFITTAAGRSIILDQPGSVFTSTVTMQAGGGSAVFGNITFVDSADVRLHSSAASAGDLYINASTDLAVGGNLSITATTGNITQSGALDIEGTTTLVTTAQGGTIDLATNGSGNAFTSELLITTNDNDSPTDGTYAAHVSVDGGTTNLIIGTSTIDGNLTLRSGGTITDTDSSTVTVKGTLSATTDASDRAITLNDLAVVGAFTLAPDGTGAVTIVNAVGLELAASTMGGTFSGTATTGDISDSGNLAITGAATFITTADDAVLSLTGLMRLVHT